MENSAGRLKGTSMFLLFAKFIISSSSVEIIHLFNNSEFFTALKVYSIKGLSHNFFMFFLGIPFDPPLAVIIPKNTFLFED